MLTLVSIVVLVTCNIDQSNGYPSEQPTKFVLNTGADNAENVASRGTPDATSKLQQAQDLFFRTADAIRIGRGRVVNSITLARNNIVHQAEQFVSNAQQHNPVVSLINTKSDILDRSRGAIESIGNLPPFKYPASRPESARLETEANQSIVEKTIDKPNLISNLLLNALKPTPVVDRTREEEKYGNSGDRFNGLGRALVNGYEGFSNFLNALVDFPRNAAKKTSRSFTNILDQVGGLLVGLQ